MAGFFAYKISNRRLSRTVHQVRWPCAAGNRTETAAPVTATASTVAIKVPKAVAEAYGLYEFEQDAIVVSYRPAPFALLLLDAFVWGRALTPWQDLSPTNGGGTGHYFFR